jgi:hypothetical protein
MGRGASIWTEWIPPSNIPARSIFRERESPMTEITVTHKITLESWQCTYRIPYGLVCGLASEAQIHPQGNERMGKGKHVWRHDGRSR